MAINLILGNLTFNAYGAAVKGQAGTTITLQVLFNPALGYYWSLKNKEANGAWTQFAISDPTSNQSQQDAFVAAVNSMDMDAFISYLAPWVAGEIARELGAYVGPLQLPPRPNPAAGLTNAANIIDRLSGILVNDFQFVPAANGLLTLARK